MLHYALIRQLLFKLEPERAHQLTLWLLRQSGRLPLLKKLQGPVKSSPCEIMGLHFANRVGLAAGLDNNGVAIDALGQLGFGFLEIGGVTPRPQPGNPKPRLFRLISDHALINRMGFPNLGVDNVVENLKRRVYSGVMGINITKNKETPLEKASEDYLYCLQRVYPFVDFITLNISSPNTPGLRELQTQAYLSDLLSTVKTEQHRLAERHKKYVPLVVKVSPDLQTDDLNQLAATLESQKIDGVIATNTTLSRPALSSASKDEGGGLSGRPLTSLSTEIVRQLYERLPKHIPIIALGGIMSVEDAIAKREAGAQLVQLYTGLIYEGPQLIADIACNSAFSA